MGETIGAAVQGAVPWVLGGTMLFVCDDVGVVLCEWWCPPRRVLLPRPRLAAPPRVAR